MKDKEPMTPESVTPNSVQSMLDKIKVQEDRIKVGEDLSYPDPLAIVEPMKEKYPELAFRGVRKDDQRRTMNSIKNRMVPFTDPEFANDVNGRCTVGDLEIWCTSKTIQEKLRTDTLQKSIDQAKRSDTQEKFIIDNGVSAKMSIAGQEQTTDNMLFPVMTTQGKAFQDQGRSRTYHVISNNPLASK